VVERQPSKLRVAGSNPVSRSINRSSRLNSLNGLNSVSAHVAQLVEHILGKDEVTGSIPVMGFETTVNSYLLLVLKRITENKEGIWQRLSLRE
jgi:hypothetical protein